MADLVGARGREALHNELEALGDIARQLRDETWSGTVSEPYAAELREAFAAIRERLKVAGYHPKHADWAVTTWILMDYGRYPRWNILACVDATTKDGQSLPPV